MEIQLRRHFRIQEPGKGNSKPLIEFFWLNKEKGDHDGRPLRFQELRKTNAQELTVRCFVVR